MYRVLYRKWRPKVFGDVVGQPHITRTLSAEVREDRLAHAYLFTGSRGTGKTTCAKILSKAINCLHPQNGDPCNECEICRGVDNGTLLDIVEIDAASNRGIDDIRLLREESGFTPAQAKYRVYIIDEVHMLTIEAFNALLKTLEEPPEHVKFILATTEVHKLPSTILSRCQRFDFRRIEPDVIARRLAYVAEQEQVTLEPDAAMLIARVADGGMRDALSLLDSAISVSSTVTSDVVSACAGLMGREYVYDLIRALAAFDTAKSLSILNELHNASCDTERLLSELTNQYRNFLIIKTVAAPENLIVCTAAELEELKTLAGSFTVDQILYALGVLTKTADSLKRTQNRRVEAEMALIRLCSPQTDTDVSALSARIAKLEAALENALSGAQPFAARPTEAASPAKPAAVPAPQVPVVPPQKETPPAPVPDAPQAPNDPPPWEETPPPPETPWESAPAQSYEDPAPFAGFAQESAGSGFGSRFAPQEETDDAPFDFDAFIAENEAKQAASASAAPAPAEETDDAPFDFDAFIAENEAKQAASASSAPAPAEETDDAPFDYDAFIAENEAKQVSLAPAPAPAPAFSQQPPAAPSAPAAAGGAIDAGLWRKVVRDTVAEYQLLTGILDGSSARRNGNVLTVRLPAGAARTFVREDVIREKLTPNVMRHIGINPDIRFES